MLQRSFKIIVVLLFFGFRVSAQFSGNVKTGGKDHAPADSLPVFRLARTIIAPDHYSSHLGFFCRQELKLEKAITIPLRIRIGSIDHVNWLERKPNAVTPIR